MQSKIKRKLVSLMLAASFVGSPLATFPMQVFAGTGSNGVMKAPEAKKVKAIQLANTPTGGKLDVGDEFTFTVIFSPSYAYADYKKVAWSSDKPEVATVDASTGKVKAIAPGQAKITATAKNGSENSEDWKTASVSITVRGVTLDKSNLAINTNQTETLQATVWLEEGADQTVTWSSNDENVATVGQDGTVTAKAPGQATITAKAGDKSASITITVIQVSLDKSTLAINTDQTETLQATVLPNEADQTITWSSSDPDVATVDQTGKVTAIAPGEATITATTANGLSATCKVYVCEVVVVKADQTPKTDSYARDDIIVDLVKLKFSETYVNSHNNNGWFRHAGRGNFTLTVKPADGSNITIQQCKFYHESTNQSYTSTGSPFSSKAFRNGDYYSITQVDVYFTRNS